MAKQIRLKNNKTFIVEKCRKCPCLGTDDFYGDPVLCNIDDDNVNVVYHHAPEPDFPDNCPLEDVPE